MRKTSSVESKAPPDKEWPFLIEPEKILTWCITFKKFEYTTGQRSGTGTVFYVEEKAGGSLMKLNFVVTEWEDNRVVAFKMVSETGVKSYEQRWGLEAILPGSRFDFMEQVELPLGVLGKLIGKMLQGGSHTTVQKMLAKLKDLAEK